MAVRHGKAVDQPPVCQSASVRQMSDKQSKRANGLPGFLLLYGSLYAAYGTESAYMPAFYRSHGLALEQIGFVFAAGTIVKTVTGPAIGRLADHLSAHKMVVAAAAGSSGVIGLAYTLAFGFA